MKKIALGILVLFIGLSTWYLFIKQYDYEITFRANLAPLGVYHQVKQVKLDTQIKNERIDQTGAYLKQETIIKNENAILDWQFKSISDTVTKIRVGIISKDHSIKNRIQVLTGSSILLNEVKHILISYRAKLRSYTDNFKVIVEGESTLPHRQVLYVSSTTQRSNKATEMMNHNGFLFPKLAEYGIIQDGYPFVRINEWNRITDKIKLDFGFPIVEQDSLPMDTRIIYDKIEAQKALKATYYGNYRNSDEAWFALIEYAKSKDILTENKPIEIFYNNPMHEANERRWKAEIFLPIKNQ
ncbi:GyrI-like domain-containing protein [Aquimarina mytili]|uniref:GyrI-like domain-containing protein n=1 Tax=Aquimarina mytili TaxID=874423 RepID=A0A936ZP97_9FLAO|nr:GyrI-like domain-containing protein [Aquimarina mytili]MBL0682218.1 GyrI-like domain-containing protein [Aquimarina mytili]